MDDRPTTSDLDGLRTHLAAHQRDGSCACLSHEVPRLLTAYRALAARVERLSKRKSSPWDAEHQRDHGEMAVR